MGELRRRCCCCGRRGGLEVVVAPAVVPLGSRRYPDRLATVKARDPPEKRSKLNWGCGEQLTWDVVDVEEWLGPG